MKIDLHSHSNYSDGSHPPEFVLARAIEKGVEQLALTDHDCINGLLQLLDNDTNPGIGLVNGVEISTLWENREIHVLGLCLNPFDSALGSLLDEQQQKRYERLHNTNKLLECAGIPGLPNYISSLPTNAPSRSHIADFLIQQGRCRTKQSVFKSWLGPRGRCYVKPLWCELTKSISTIRQAGGIAVLAHPHRYQLNKSVLKRLLTEFRMLGGEGMEVCSSSTNLIVVNNLAALCEEFNLLASAGSDFHSIAAHWADLGSTPPLPERCKKNAIWLHPAWHCNSG